MSAGKYDFTLEQGATFSRDIVYKDANGAIVNLTGYSARMQIRVFKDSSAALLSATTQNGKITVDGAAGKISVVIAPSDTNALDFDKAVYDLEIESASGTVVRLLEGIVSFSKQVTR